jgi:uncharacterized protein (TIGR02001 family)
MKKLLLAATLLGAMAAGSALADDGLSFNIGSSSDYMFRGITQTQNSVAIQGGVDYTKGTFYSGAWASNVDFGDSTDLELDLYAGVKPTYGLLTFDFAGILYTYHNQPKYSHLSVAELKAGVSAPFGKGTIGAAAYIGVDDHKANGDRGIAFGDSLYGEINASYPLTDGLTVSGAMGNTKIKNGNFVTPSSTVVDTDEYSTYNVGVTFAMTSNISFDVRYHDTNRHDFGAAFKPKTVASIKATF